MSSWLATFHFLSVTVVTQCTKKMQHPGNDRSSTSTGPKNKKTSWKREASDLSTSYSWQCLVLRELWELRSKRAPAITAYCQSTVRNNVTQIFEITTLKKNKSLHLAHLAHTITGWVRPGDGPYPTTFQSEFELLSTDKILTWNTINMVYKVIGIVEEKRRLKWTPITRHTIHVDSHPNSI